jgi:TonB-linked SusC/RagA family outer membrane protein
MEDSNVLTMNALVNYTTSINNIHNIKVLFGTERRSGETFDFEAFRKYFVSDAIDELFAGGDAEKNNTGKATLNARLNYFGRANYDFSGKYLFEFVWRYDGSYIFEKESRFGFFPGVSLGWRISEETFWKNNLSVFNHFKIRGSWGQTGNDRIDPYQYLASYGFLSNRNQLYTFNFNNEQKVLNELRIPNKSVTWEVANQSNIGFDGQMLNGKLSFEADYFYNVRPNILWTRNASVPASTGLTLPRENIGEVVNKGFEFVVSYSDRLGDFNYRVGVNANFNNNKIRFWDETPGIPEYQQSTGYPMNTSLYYKAIGIFHTQAEVDAYPHWAGARPGDVIFEDVNGDGKIDGLDRVRIYKSDLPTHTGGFNLDLSYKNIYLSAFLQWATGAVRYDYYEMQGETGNFLKRNVEGRWTESNPNANKPRIWNRYAEYWRNNQNTYWLQESNYLRLKNLEVGYNVPASLISKFHVEGIRIYFTGMNLLTFTKIKDFDPETTSATAYPLNKIFNLGINFNF